MITAREAAEICGKPTKSGKGWKCQCPAHDDNTASLKIDDGQGDTLLVKCFAGCEQMEVIKSMEAIGAWPPWSGSKSVSKKPKPVKKTPKKEVKRRQVATYDYVSADGELLYQAVRFEPKDFRQRRPAAGGGWDWSLGDTELVPFMLPELLAAIKNDRYVFVVEGEKDVLAMRDRIEAGVVATCCPMGAKKWKPEYNQHFEGASVVVIPDNDKPGREHAVQVAEHLRTICDVRVMELPGVGEHGDISDWIDLGGTKRHLNVLVKETFKEGLRFPDEPAPPPSAPGPSKPPDLGVVEQSGAVRKPEEKPKDNPELATDAVAAVWNNLNLVLNNNARPIPNLDNALRVIEGHGKTRGCIYYDEFADRIRSDWGANLYEWTDGDTRRLALMMQREICISQMKQTTVHEAVLAAGKRNVRNPPKEYMLGVLWDNKPRLKHLMPEGFGTARNDYTEAVGRCFIMGMVARVLAPGCKVDNMPVLEGPQGGLKSTALGILGGEWFAECHEPVTSKDFFQVMQGCMLIEISELHAFRRSEVERIKGVITCRVDRYRKSYGRLAEDHPRSSVFAGTTNVDDWNADETGARRFWPILCGFIDTIWIEDNRDQLFAEAVYLIQDGEKHWNVPEDQARAEQESRRKHDEWEGLLIDYIEGRPRYIAETGRVEWEPRLDKLDECTVREFLEEALQIRPGNQGRPEQMRASAAFKLKGWERKRRGGLWIYVSPTNPRHSKYHLSEDGSEPDS